MMRWDNPETLLLWWILPAIAIAILVTHRRQQRRAERFAQRVMLDRLLPVAGSTRKWIKAALLIVALGFLIAGAARPRWGLEVEEIQTRGADVFVLLDVSRSMLAEDVAPNRMERAKSDIRDLLSRLAGDRVGLIVFAGAAVVQIPLTTDQQFFLSAMAAVDDTSAPRGGTLIGDAIRKAVTSFPNQADRDRALVIITDGEDQESFPEEAAQEAVAMGVKIFTVGLGDTEEGARIPIQNDSGSLGFLQYEGQEHWSQLNENLLRKIALDSGGAYVPARTQTYDLGQIYEQHLSQLARGEIQSERRKTYREQFQVLLAIGLSLMLLETAIPRYPPLRAASS